MPAPHDTRLMGAAATVWTGHGFLASGLADSQTLPNHPSLIRLTFYPPLPTAASVPVVMSLALSKQPSSSIDKAEL